MILQKFPPMGVYETLFKFMDATAMYMGDPGTHPWAQGYPLTTQLPGGPPLPEQIDIAYTDGPLKPDSYDADMAILSNCV